MVATIDTFPSGESAVISRRIEPAARAFVVAAEKENASCGLELRCGVGRGAPADDECADACGEHRDERECNHERSFRRRPRVGDRPQPRSRSPGPPVFSTGGANGAAARCAASERGPVLRERGGGGSVGAGTSWSIVGSGNRVQTRP